MVPRFVFLMREIIVVCLLYFSGCGLLDVEIYFISGEMICIP